MGATIRCNEGIRVYWVLQQWAVPGGYTLDSEMQSPVCHIHSFLLGAELCWLHAVEQAWAAACFLTQHV